MSSTIKAGDMVRIGKSIRPIVEDKGRLGFFEGQRFQTLNKNYIEVVSDVVNECEKIDPSEAKPQEHLIIRGLNGEFAAIADKDGRLHYVDSDGKARFVKQLNQDTELFRQKNPPKLPPRETNVLNVLESYFQNYDKDTLKDVADRILNINK